MANNVVLSFKDLGLKVFLEKSYGENLGYKDEDYKNNPKPYCGIKITESPLETKDIPKYIETKETRESFKQS